MHFSRASGAIKTALRRENGGEYLAAKIGTLFCPTSNLINLALLQWIMDLTRGWPPFQTFIHNYSTGAVCL